MQPDRRFMRQGQGGTSDGLRPMREVARTARTWRGGCALANLDRSHSQSAPPSAKASYSDFHVDPARAQARSQLALVVIGRAMACEESQGSTIAGRPVLSDPVLFS